ncbi:MAG: TolC family protein, partial [Burkholderiales bacterium]|nr:TolC family protein [Burkholderiales bacterium]
ERTYRITQGQYRAGGLSYLAVLDAQQRVAQARLARIQATAQRYADSAALLQALGGGWWAPGAPD